MKAVVEILEGIRPEFKFGEVADFFEAGMLDSFDLMTLVSTLDQEYGIRIDGLDILPENFRNVAAIMVLLNKYGVQA